MSPEGFNISAARPIDAKACRMLLPRAPQDGRYLVARDNETALAVGVAAIANACRPLPLVGPGVMVHVILPRRRQGIGSALCEALMNDARERGMRALYAARKVELGGDEAEGWRRLGFTPCETVEEHSMSLDQFVPRLGPLVERFRRQGRIPSDARIIPLYAADRDRVVQLHLDYLGGDRDDLHRKILGRGPGAFHPRYSCVLMVGDQMAGCLLNHLQMPRAAVVDANIVIPQFRNGWANLWLKLEATRGALSLGIEQFLFTSFDHYVDTRSFTAKLGGIVTRRLVLMHRPL